MNIIIAGNKNEYLNWIRTNNVERKTDYLYVTQCESLRGLRDVKGRFIGSYRRRSDILYIIECLMAGRLANDSSYEILIQLHASITKERGG